MQRLARLRSAFPWRKRRHPPLKFTLGVEVGLPQVAIVAFFQRDSAQFVTYVSAKWSMSDMLKS